VIYNKCRLNPVGSNRLFMFTINRKGVLRRTGDWLASGGKEVDPYIYQQLRYAKRFVRE
jgi:hypothetical protein